MKKYQTHRNIICIDLKSFYASVECALRGLDPFEVPLVVADRSRGDGAISLATTPYLKSLGIPSRCRIFEIPDALKETIIYAQPRMNTYLDYTMKIIEIYLSFISDEDLYVYSIDEAFLDVTNYLTYYQMTDVELAKAICKKIYKDLKLPSSCGVGPNMLIAKLAMDLEGKYQKDGVAKWNYSDISTKLWPIYPLSKMWGIGNKTEKHLNVMGIYTIGDLANYDVAELKRRFGVIGEELYYHAHGIDQSQVQDKDKLRTKSKSFGNSQILFKDYFIPDIYTIILEMADQLSRRLRMAKKEGKTLSFGIGYSKDYGGGFSRQRSFEYPTNSFTAIYEMCLSIFKSYYDEESAIRSISVGITGLTNVSTTYQLSLFEDYEEVKKENELLMMLDEIKTSYGKNAINRGSSLSKESTVVARNQFVGGHHE